MIDSPESYNSLSETESMIRSAGSYMQVSKDLRPRVLEAARLKSGERRARRFIRQAALIAALLTWCITSSVDRLDGASNFRELTLAAVASYPVSNNQVSGAGGAAWALADAYTELRGRQAGLLRLSQ